MRQGLTIHPDSRATATDVTVDVERGHNGALVLRYVVSGTVGDILVPRLKAPKRRDELWKHTCFEAFLRPEGGDSYFEFNFSPSTEWAAYRFSGYRQGMALVEIKTPFIDLRAGDQHIELHVRLELGNIAGLPADGPWRAGITCILEETDSEKAYWALAHPQGKPDFHHADGFALKLPAGKT